MEAWVVIVSGLLKTLILLYDIITLPVYFLIQKPWRILRRVRRPRATWEDSEDPYSAFVRIEEVPYEIVPRAMIHNETIDETFKSLCKLHGSKKCYGYRKVFAQEDEKQPNGKVFKKLIMADDYKWVSYEDVDKAVHAFAKGLISNGIKSGDKVVIFAETRPEWMQAVQAIFQLGGIAVTLYATLGEDGVVHGMNESDATCVITSSALIPKLIKLESKIPNVKTIIFMPAQPAKKETFTEEATNRFNIRSFEQVVEDGKKLTEEQFKEEVNLPKPDDVAFLMYTSGSTGNPKAVMITHRNFLTACQSCLASVLSEYGLDKNEAYLAYLPLAHIFELLGEFLMLLLGIPIGYSSTLTMLEGSTALKKGVKGDISILKPTIMPAVPLILDRIRKTINDQIRRKGPLLESVFDFMCSYKNFWAKRGFRTPIADRTLFKACHKSVGGNMKLLLAGGAPLSVETQEFISAVLNVRLLQGYASTEASGAAAVMDLYDFSSGRVGAPLFGTKLKLVDWREGGYFATDKPHPRGEIVIGGDNVSLGYYKNESETEKCYVVENGTRWWYTGDIGEIFEDGTIKIIDRKKDLVKLQMGEYISLGKVESGLKNCRFVENICVYGNSFHNNIIALIIPNRKSLKEAAVAVNKENLSFEEQCEDKDIIAIVKKDLAATAAKHGLSKSETPTDLKLCSETWDPDNGLVTAALKIRRKQIEEFYRNDIMRMYSSNGSSKST